MLHLGIMEAVDMVIVTKADGDLLQPAAQTQADYSNALHFIKNKYHQYYYHPSPFSSISSPSSSSTAFLNDSIESKENYNSSTIFDMKVGKLDWTVPVVLFSNQSSPPSLQQHQHNKYLDVIENHIKTFHTLLIDTHIIDLKRNEQKIFWMENKVKRLLIADMEQNDDISKLRKGEIRHRVMRDEITPATAAKMFLETFYTSIRNERNNNNSSSSSDKYDDHNTS